MATAPLSNLTRLLHNLLGVGRVTAVEHSSSPSIRVTIGGVVSRFVPYPAAIGRNWRGWFPRRLGDQVVIGCRSGDPANLEILSSRYTNDAPPPSTDDHIDTVVFNDGTAVTYDSDAHRLTIAVQGDLHLTASGSIVIDGKSISLHTGEGGAYQLDMHGMASRTTHMGGSAFKAETWQAGAVVSSTGDQGYHAPRVEDPA